MILAGTLFIFGVVLVLVAVYALLTCDKAQESQRIPGWLTRSIGAGLTGLLTSIGVLAGLQLEKMI